MPSRTTKDDRRVSVLLGDDVGFLREKEILAVFPIGARSWRRGVKEGIYPKPVKLSPRVNGWSIVAIKKLLATTADDAA